MPIVVLTMTSLDVFPFFTIRWDFWKIYMYIQWDIEGIANLPALENIFVCLIQC